MLDKAYAALREASIDPRKASWEPRLAADMGDTMNLAVVARDGNVASIIQSPYGLFVSAVAVEGRSFILHNRAGRFCLEPNKPNTLKPRTRPFHAIIPALLGKGDLRGAFGIIGGENQPQVHARLVSNIADFQMNIQAALDAPRFLNSGPTGCKTQIEQRIPAQVRQQLSSRGHKLDVHGDYYRIGPGEAVMRDQAKGINYGTSDSRGDRAAVSESPVF
jgi:gamma-glutamyltranspeptidase/glutathione hydrolase